jgi:hypothetical protein
MLQEVNVLDLKLLLQPWLPRIKLWKLDANNYLILLPIFKLKLEIYQLNLTNLKLDVPNLKLLSLLLKLKLWILLTLLPVLTIKLPDSKPPLEI